MSPPLEDYFVCIGAQKSATTWLARMLSHHRDMFVTPVKEIHYFDHVAGITGHLNARKKRSRYRKYFQRALTQPHNFRRYKSQWNWYRSYMSAPHDEEWYKALFKNRGGACSAGEATPEYALLDIEGYRRIKRLAPDARIIYIMRNPVTRSWSQLLHHCRRHKLDAAALSQSQIEKIVSTDNFSRFGDYLSVLEKLALVFSSDQVHLDFFEDIHADRRQGLQRICSFIGAGFDAEDFPDLATRYNRSQKAQMPAPVSSHLRALYRPMVIELADRLDKLPGNWHREFSL